MRKKSSIPRFVFAVAWIVLGTQGCMRIRVNASPTPAEFEGNGTVETNPQIDAGSTPFEKAGTSTPPAIDGIPTQTRSIMITVTAIKGNLFIRRGPDMAFNPVDVLYENSSAEVIGRDVLSKWVQIIIPGTNQPGWVSVQTDYSQVNGDLGSLPDFTPTEWPLPAYLRNCTHHRMYILPGETILPSTYEIPENEIWLYPGRYNVYDLDVPGEPEVLQVDMREGLEIDIRTDGLGEKRKCP
jgi:hypothetical protein